MGGANGSSKHSADKLRPPAGITVLTVRRGETRRHGTPAAAFGRLLRWRSAGRRRMSMAGDPKAEDMSSGTGEPTYRNLSEALARITRFLDSQAEPKPGHGLEAGLDES